MASKPTGAPAPWEQKVRLFRKRFAAREDVFYLKRAQEVFETDDKGDRIKVTKNKFSPACSNFWKSDLCLLVNKKGTCYDCSNKAYAPLTDEVARKHIYGEHVLCPLILRAEGIKFGAIDFDQALTGDGIQSVFEDAKMIRDFYKTLGVPCHLARSSNKGYHLYFFFSEFVPAHHFTSLVRWVWVKSGYNQRFLLNPGKVGMPEVFPKQTVFSSTMMGNGIRVPMSEPDMRRGKNCWVDDEANPIPFDQQWTYFAELEEVTPELLAKVIADNQVTILEAPVSRGARQIQKEVQSGTVGGGGKGSDEKSIKPFGSFWGIVAGCPAMREYWAKDEKGIYKWDTSNPKGLFNSARVASMTLAMATQDGEDVIRSRWPTDATEKQIQSAQQKGYAPTTCRWMQDQGVCHVGKHPRFHDHCMKKLPPISFENGQPVINPDKLPEDQWPEPSPIRYATEKHLSVEEILERLELLFREPEQGSGETTLDDAGRPVVTAEYRPENREAMLHSLFKRIGKLNAPDQKKVMDSIKVNKWLSQKELKEFLKEIRAEEAKEAIEEKKQKFEYTIWNNTMVHVANSRYVKTIHNEKTGVNIEIPITNFYLDVQEDRAEVRLNEQLETGNAMIVENRWVSGFIHHDNQKKPFLISHTEWASKQKFFPALIRFGGVGLQYAESEYDLLRNVVCALSPNYVVRKMTTDIGNHRFPAGHKFLMPSVTITKDGILTNDEFRIELKNDLCRPLDFKILDDEEWKDLSRHIVYDLFQCNNPIVTMTAFGHAVAAALADRLSTACNYRKAPVLWVSGDHGQGKTFVLESIQYFYGNFSRGMQVGSAGSFKAKISAADHYRHAFLLFDDVKDSIRNDQGKEIVSFVQSAYDRNGRAALTRDGKQREKSDKVRGLVAITGEDFPSNEASTISRMILIDNILKADRDRGKEVLAQRHQYMGFMPHVIHMWMNLEDADIRQIWDDAFLHLRGNVTNADDRSNQDRICENLTLNMLGLRVALETMVLKGAITEQKRDELCRQHMKNLEILKASMIMKVTENRASVVFLDGLKQLLQNPTKFYIQGHPSFAGVDATRGAVALGWASEKNPRVIYLHPDLAYNHVRALHKESVFQSKQHVARQLYNDGFMDESEVPRTENRYSCQRRGPHGATTRVYPLKASALGFDDLSAVASHAQQEIRPTQTKTASSDDEFPLE